MRRVGFWSMPLLVLVPALWAGDDPKDKPKEDKPPTPTEQFRALMGELNKARQEIGNAYTQAKTDEDREKVIADYEKKPAEFTGRALELAQKNPKDQVAFDALTFVVRNTRKDAEGDKAVAILLQNHANRLGALLPRVQGASSPAVEKLCRAVAEKSTDHQIQAQALYSLANYLKNRTEKPELPAAEVEKISQEAERLLSKVSEKFADTGKLAEEAKEALADLRMFGIGKTAPDIEGEDIDGKKFKLSDYRGKVVVLDFWGNW